MTEILVILPYFPENKTIFDMYDPNSNMFRYSSYYQGDIRQ